MFLKLVFASKKCKTITLNFLFKKICKETGDIKLSPDASLNIYEDQLNQLEKTIETEKEKKSSRLGKSMARQPRTS